MSGMTNQREIERQLLLQKMPKAAVCAEVGVWRAAFSELILSITSPRMLHLIDPWQFMGEFPKRIYGGSVATNQNYMDRVYESVAKKFAGNPNVVLNRATSERALSAFADGYLDWVYLDGNHSYDFVSSDLRICRSKVKPGGIIAGDDYTWGEKEDFPVKRAVQEFVAANGMANPDLIGSQYVIRLPSR